MSNTNTNARENEHENNIQVSELSGAANVTRDTSTEQGVSGETAAEKAAETVTEATETAEAPAEIITEVPEIAEKDEPVKTNDAGTADDAAVKAKKKLKDRKKSEKRKKIATIIAFLTLIAIIIVLLLRSCSKEEPELTNDVGQGTVVIDTNATDEELKQENPLANRNVYFSGIVDSKISKKGSVQLLNDAQNEDFLMKFIITNKETGEKLYETDLVPSGKSVYWTPGETLKEGTYKLTVEEVPYYVYEDGSYITLSVGRNDVEITII